jgi:hypothetical protein
VRSEADFENLGKAFEGLAGALHEGYPIEPEDLDAACHLAHELWVVRGGGHEPHEKDFESARLACRTYIPLALQGDLKAWTLLQKACHHIGLALRWKSRNVASPRGSAAAHPWQAAGDIRAGIKRLDHKYARYALNPIYLPM